MDGAHNYYFVGSQMAIGEINFGEINNTIRAIQTKKPFKYGQ